MQSTSGLDRLQNLSRGVLPKTVEAAFLKEVCCFKAATSFACCIQRDRQCREGHGVRKLVGATCKHDGRPPLANTVSEQPAHRPTRYLYFCHLWWPALLSFGVLVLSLVFSRVLKHDVLRPPRTLHGDRPGGKRRALS